MVQMQAPYASIKTEKTFADIIRRKEKHQGLCRAKSHIATAASLLHWLIHFLQFGNYLLHPNPMAWCTLYHKCKYFLSLWAGRIGKKNLHYKVPKIFKAGKNTQTKEILHKCYSKEVEVNILNQLFLLNNNSFKHFKVQS